MSSLDEILCFCQRAAAINLWHQQAFDDDDDNNEYSGNNSQLIEYLHLLALNMSLHWTFCWQLAHCW